MHEDPLSAPERPDEPGSDALLIDARGRLPDAEELLAHDELLVEGLHIAGDEPDDAPDPEDPHEEER
jgi:hypothetical protein